MHFSISHYLKKALVGCSTVDYGHRNWKIGRYTTVPRQYAIMAGYTVKSIAGVKFIQKMG